MFCSYCAGGGDAASEKTKKKPPHMVVGCILVPHAQTAHNRTHVRYCVRVRRCVYTGPGWCFVYGSDHRKRKIFRNVQSKMKKKTKRNLCMTDRFPTHDVPEGHEYTRDRTVYPISVLLHHYKMLCRLYVLLLIIFIHKSRGPTATDKITRGSFVIFVVGMLLLLQHNIMTRAIR